MKKAGWLVVALSTIACGGDGGGGDGGGSGGPGEPELRCMPSNATVVAPEFEHDDLLRRVIADDTHVFVAGVYEIYAAPRDGGPAVKVYPPEGETGRTIYPAYWVREDELLVGAGDEIRVLPKLGGEVQETITLPFRFTTNFDGTPDAFLDADGKTLFAKQDPIVADGGAPDITYFSYDLESGDSRTILEGAEIGYRELMVKSGDYLYTTHSPDRSFTSTGPDELHRIPVAGGAPEKLPVEGEFEMELVGADEAHLYFHGYELPPDPAGRPAGIYRIPLAGGKPEKLVVTHPVPRSMLGFVDRGDHVVVWAMTGVYRIAKASGKVDRLVASDCIWGMTADEGVLYLALEPEESKGTIVQVPY